jgi:ribokinase
MPRIAVVGSLNMDLVVHAPRLPEAGETVLGNAFRTAPGGKGANQAVAAALASGPETEVFMVGCVGTDDYGRALTKILAENGVNVDHVRVKNEVTGIATIGIEAGGQNRIVVVPGANGQLTADDVHQALRKIAPDRVLVQQEIPDAAILAAVQGKAAVLNPAPARRLPSDAYPGLDLLVPNETEAQVLTRMADPAQAGQILRTWGPMHVIVTRGADGLLYTDGERTHFRAAFTVEPVDTVAAGDTFCGALVAALVEGSSLDDATAYASAAAALSTTRPGAMESAPTRSEIRAFLAAQTL